MERQQHTTETKQKISKSLTGYKQSDEHIKLRQEKRKETLRKKLQAKLARKEVVGQQIKAEAKLCLDDFSFPFLARLIGLGEEE